MILIKIVAFFIPRKHSFKNEEFAEYGIWGNNVYTELAYFK